MSVPSPQHSCKTHIHIEEQISEKENKPHHPIKQLTKQKDLCMAYSCNPSTQEAEDEDCHEFEVRLSNTVSSRLDYIVSSVPATGAVLQE